jgi:hypothetical protein
VQFVQEPDVHGVEQAAVGGRRVLPWFW